MMMTKQEALRRLLSDPDSRKIIGADRKTALEQERERHPSSELAMHVDASSAARHLHLLFPSQRSLR